MAVLWQLVALLLVTACGATDDSVCTSCNSDSNHDSQALLQTKVNVHDVGMMEAIEQRGHDEHEKKPWFDSTSLDEMASSQGSSATGDVTGSGSGESTAEVARTLACTFFSDGTKCNAPFFTETITLQNCDEAEGCGAQCALQANEGCCYWRGDSKTCEFFTGGSLKGAPNDAWKKNAAICTTAQATCDWSAATVIPNMRCMTVIPQRGDSKTQPSPLWSSMSMSRTEAQAKCNEDSNCVALYFFKDLPHAGFYQGCPGTAGTSSDTRWDKILKPDGCKVTCFENNKKYTPHMSGQGRSVETGALGCQQRCASVSGCAHFSSWQGASVGDGGCFLQDSAASPQTARGATAGPPSCPQVCDASTAPSNGGVGDCTSNLAPGSKCQPTCNSGHTPSGTSSCSLRGIPATASSSSVPAGVLTAATCEASFALGDVGVDGCPNGYTKITSPEECEGGASALGLQYTASSNDGHADSLCNWCGICDGHTVRVSNSHGGVTKWLCKKQASPTATKTTTTTTTTMTTTTTTATTSLVVQVNAR